MAEQTPGQNPHVINDLVPGVIAALANKTDITPQNAAIWIKKTLLNLTASYKFEELRVQGPMVTVGPGMGYQGSNFQYLISQFLNAGDDYTLQESPVIFLTPTQAATAGLVNAGTTSGAVVGYPLPYMTPTAIQTLLFIPGGIPSRYTRYGNQFWIGTQPGMPYQMYLPYQRSHPFNDSNLLQSPLYIPTRFEDLIEYSAALRGANENRWPDQVKNLREIIYGDPKGEGEPGLLKAMVSQITMDQDKSTRQVIPTVSRY
jgi:hypothetical protein